MLLKLQENIIYGPVNSRRLGASLGVNILPSNRKVCSFDCLYCQYGRGRVCEERDASQICFPAADDVFAALEQALETLPFSPAYITFSGNGEATLHPRFREIVVGLREIRDRVSPSSQTAILSNATTVDKPDIRETLEMLDVRIMKLDAGEPHMFETYNGPASGVKFEKIVEGLAKLQNVTLQTLFTDGVGGNYTQPHLERWLEQVERISPLAVQVYTLDRQSPTGSLKMVATGQLEEICRLLGKVGVIGEAFS